MEQEEIWRDIEGYEMIYQVSNLGRVRSLERIDYSGHLRNGRILSPAIDKYGYLQVRLCKEGKQKTYTVHRLVAQAFIPNPEGLPVINHKNEDKTLNVVFLKDDGSVDESRSNLEWCTVRYNNTYGTCKERMVQTKIRNGLFNPELCGLTRKEYNRMYRQKNMEKIQEHKRELYQKNREKIREQNKERYQKNREKRLEYQREYYQKYRIKKKQEEKDNRPSGESLW